MSCALTNCAVFIHFPCRDAESLCWLADLPLGFDLRHMMGFLEMTRFLGGMEFRGLVKWIRV